MVLPDPLPSPEGPVVMTLQHVHGVLLVLPVGLGMALGVMLLEWLYFKVSSGHLVVTFFTRDGDQKYNRFDTSVPAEWA